MDKLKWIYCWVLLLGLYSEVPNTKATSFREFKSTTFDQIAAAVSYENTGAVSFVDIECPTVVSSTINVPDSLIITDVNIGFNATITYRHHVTVTLESPNGTMVELTSVNAYTGASASISNWDVLFDEASANPLNDGNSDNTATPNYENERIANPSGNLNNLNGENSSGIWRLHVCDYTTGTDNGGTLNKWKIEIEGNTPCSANGDTPISTVGTCDGAQANDDAIVNVGNIINADRADISSPGALAYDGDPYATAETVMGGNITFGGLQHNENYIIRVYETGGGCFTDLFFTSANSLAECPSLPTELPWLGATCNGKTTILQNGIGALTCGVTTSTATSERWAFALMNFDNIIPSTGRIDSTTAAEVYHHDSWHVDSIGNVFGIAMNTQTGEMFLTASSNYGAGFLGSNAVIRYGSIAGGTASGTNDSAAGGAVYKIDATTGQASVFTFLPQQTVTFTNEDCESTDVATRTNSGVGLGNIVYDEVNDQYFASNIEDGRIYRLSNTGVILDSYDPFSHDDGVAGISSLEELVYGLAVELATNRLFFGGLDAVSGTGAQPGSPGIYSIDLTASGGFSGSVNNTNMPSGATYNNYESSDVFHTNIPIAGGTTPSTNDYVYLISDLEFTNNGELLAGVRVSCNSSFFSSYNHFSEVNIITKDLGTGKFNNSVTELDVSAIGNYADEDTYGGVAAYTDGLGNDIIGVSSSDILNENGPHGIAVFSDPPNAGAITPLAAVSYSVSGFDPKGVGGDINLWGSCMELDYDYGDLPDIADGTTGTNDYETYDSTGGPRHQIITGLFLGNTVDADNDGFPNAEALGDDNDGTDDEDGVIIAAQLDVIPGGIIRLPISVTNTTGDTAYVEAWIDWNGNGDFDIINELVIDIKDNTDGVFPNYIEIAVPTNVLIGSLVGFRIRLSNSDNMTPYGQINSGEVEDYLLGIECKQVICLPIETAIKKE